MVTVKKVKLSNCYLIKNDKEVTQLGASVSDLVDINSSHPVAEL